MKSPTCPPLQAKLLRVTQNGCFNRVGSNTELQTNARILAATNSNLEEGQAGCREDLFYRLNVVNQHATAPRTPGRHPAAGGPFHRGIYARQGRFRRRWRSAWSDIPWPGNVRELRNAMRAALLAQ
jgi:DNA-binding NtrC family response regulator